MTANPSTRDHPRVCGEHCTVLTNESWKPGSSPRMRGTLQRSPQRHVPAGIIPAYAGNTCVRFAPSSASGDHPRVCGEHSTCVTVGPGDTGSSPRMRGTQCVPKATYHGIGIIPAYAGNTTCFVGMSDSRRDHPRVCGEHNLLTCTGARRTGSSPRMRGTRGH